MNLYTVERYEENRQRLALGLEPIDAARGMRILHPVEVVLDLATPKGWERPRAERHASALHILRFFPDEDTQLDLTYRRAAASGSGSSEMRRQVPIPSEIRNGQRDYWVDIRLFDQFRRFVPRRLRIPVLVADAAEGRPASDRSRHPVLFPGAAYDVSPNATGLRGRVLRLGQTMRWARVEATLQVNSRVVGRAHGDDRGEFLLLIDATAVTVGGFVEPLPLRVTIYGPASKPEPVSPDQPMRDPLWDLPQETASAPGTADDVSAGGGYPDGYVASVSPAPNGGLQVSSWIVDFSLGRLLNREFVFI